MTSTVRGATIPSLPRSTEIFPTPHARVHNPKGAAPMSSAEARPHAPRDLEHAVIRFAGDPGDGMQLTGSEFTREVALHGNDLATFPDFPAEIRAPAGTVAGVSGYQVQFAAHEVYSAGDAPDTLVAMNPAALQVHLPDLRKGGLLILNEATFTPADLARAGWKDNPLTDHSLDGYRVLLIDFDKLVRAAVEGTGVNTKEAGRCKNFFALGLVFWLYGRDKERQEKSIRDRFAKAPALAEANVRAFRAGHAYGETVEMTATPPYRIAPARLPKGRYRNITGSTARALGLPAAPPEGRRPGCGCSSAAIPSPRRATSCTSWRGNAASR